MSCQPGVLKTVSEPILCTLKQYIYINLKQNTVLFFWTYLNLLCLRIEFSSKLQFCVNVTLTTTSYASGLQLLSCETIFFPLIHLLWTTAAKGRSSSTCQCSSVIWRIHLSDCLLSHDLSPLCTHTTNFHISGRVKYFLQLKNSRFIKRLFHDIYEQWVVLGTPIKPKFLRTAFLSRRAIWILSGAFSLAAFNRKHHGSTALSGASTSSCTSAMLVPCAETTWLALEQPSLATSSQHVWGQNILFLPDEGRDVSFVKSLSRSVLKWKRWKREGGLELKIKLVSINATHSSQILPEEC